MEMKRFLCCFSTREGNIVCAIGTLIIVVLRIYFLWFNISFLNRLTETQMKDLPLSFDVLLAISIVQTTAAVATMIAAILLLIGVMKHKKNFLIPWMGCVIFEEALDMCIVIFYISKKIKINSSVYIGDSVFLVINLYCVFCVYSYFKQLKKEEVDNKRPIYSLGDDSDESDEEPILSERSQII